MYNQKDIVYTQNYEKLVKEVILTEAEQVRLLAQKIPYNINEVINALSSIKGKIIITGMGKSGIIGKKIAATMSSLGTSSFFIHPAEAYHGDLGMVDEEDGIIALSNSGETEELLKLISFIKNQGNILISVTGAPQSTLAQNSDFHIDVSVNKEACPYQLAPTSSTTVALVIGDALAIALSQSKNFKPEDFAKFHPGGQLGRRLLTKVNDAMKQENLPVCSSTDKLTDVVHVISRGRCGLVVVCEGKKVTGIITDGDIRRTMTARNRDFFYLKAFDIMIQNPKYISKEEKLNKAEQIMNENKITSLLVMDDDVLEGIIQIYDL